MIGACFFFWFCNQIFNFYTSSIDIYVFIYTVNVWNTKKPRFESNGSKVICDFKSNFYNWHKRIHTHTRSFEHLTLSSLPFNVWFANERKKTQLINVKCIEIAKMNSKIIYSSCCCFCIWVDFQIYGGNILWWEKLCFSCKYKMNWERSESFMLFAVDAVTSANKSLYKLTKNLSTTFY